MIAAIESIGRGAEAYEGVPFAPYDIAATPDGGVLIDPSSAVTMGARSASSAAKYVAEPLARTASDSRLPPTCGRLTYRCGLGGIVASVVGRELKEALVKDGIDPIDERAARLAAQAAEKAKDEPLVAGDQTATGQPGPRRGPLVGHGQAQEHLRLAPHPQRGHR